MCRQYHALPYSGGLMEQPIALLRWMAVIAAAGEDGAASAQPRGEFDDLIASLGMESL